MTDRLRGLEIDHQLELGRLLDGKVGGLCAAQALAVREETTRLRTLHLAKEAAKVETEVRPVLCGPEFPSDFNH